MLICKLPKPDQQFHTCKHVGKCFQVIKWVKSSYYHKWFFLYKTYNYYNIAEKESGVTIINGKTQKLCKEKLEKYLFNADIVALDLKFYMEKEEDADKLVHLSRPPLNGIQLLGIAHTLYYIIDNNIDTRYSKLFLRNSRKVVFDYLWIACLGESRHASGIADIMINGLTRKTDRSTVYDNLSKFYEPSPENIQAIIDVFDSRWRDSSFGGKNWGKIAKHLLNSKQSDIRWLDEALHLQHNSGCVFNKFMIFSDLRDTLCSGTIESLMHFFGYRTDKPTLDYRFNLKLYSPVIENKDIILEKRNALALLAQSRGINSKFNTEFVNWQWPNIEYSSGKLEAIQNPKYKNSKEDDEEEEPKSVSDPTPTVYDFNYFAPMFEKWAKDPYDVKYNHTGLPKGEASINCGCNICKGYLEVHLVKEGCECSWCNYAKTMHGIANKPATTILANPKDIQFKKYGDTFDIKCSLPDIIIFEPAKEWKVIQSLETINGIQKRVYTGGINA